MGYTVKAEDVGANHSWLLIVFRISAGQHGYHVGVTTVCIGIWKFLFRSFLFRLSGEKQNEKKKKHWSLEKEKHLEKHG